MTYENLIASMEVNAEKSIAELVQKARHEAEEIMRSAEAKADTIRAAYLENAQKLAESERNRLTYKVKAENKMEIIKEKDAVIQQAFFDAKKSLESFRDDASYKENFRKMFKEAVSELEGERVILHVDARDQMLSGQVLDELGWNAEVVGDLTSEGGLAVTSKDGKLLVSNTIESRLNNVKELLKREIFSTLFGD